jgi:hypothetical protein
MQALDGYLCVGRRPLGDRGVADRQRAAEEWEMSYLATTETVTWISDTPGILTIVPDT